jgi:concentrative nucleoside transporter, CNT family
MLFIIFFFETTASVYISPEKETSTPNFFNATTRNMDRFIGLLGIVVLLGIAYLLSNNRKAINYRTVGMGLLIQALLAVFILKTSAGQAVFGWLGKAVTKVLSFSDVGARFVFGVLGNDEKLAPLFGNETFIFFVRIIPTIIFVACLVNIFYHIGLMQWIVQMLAKGLNFFMRVSGAEALSNISSAFVGQVEAQIMIKPYLKGMTNSELMASMSGSFACIAGGVMATYIKFGVPAEYLIAASIMAAPGALAIAKIMYPETDQPETEGEVRLKVEKQHSNLVDAISAGCSDGLKVGLNVVAMLIGFLALIALINFILSAMGGLVGYPEFNLNTILGGLFAGFAWVMGVPGQDMMTAGALMGTKLVANEFVAYLQLKDLITTIDPKTLVIVSFALCGFANFGSVGIQIGGISALEPSRRSDLAKLGFRALVAGTLASYVSATLAGLLH